MIDGIVRFHVILQGIAHPINHAKHVDYEWYELCPEYLLFVKVPISFKQAVDEGGLENVLVTRFVQDFDEA